MMKELIDAAGMKQRDVVRKTGLSQATICRFYLGIRRPSAEQAMIISDKCGFPLHALRPDIWPAPKGRSA